MHASITISSTSRLVFLYAACGLLAACGGGGSGVDGAEAVGAGQPPVPAPAPAPSSPPESAASVSGSLYFSDCQVGAVAGCVPGNNANPGTESAPKRDLSGIDLGSLVAGTTLLFKRGGSWNMPTLQFQNPNTSAASPLTFTDWGTGPLPVLRKTSGNLFQFADGNGPVSDGGYVIRNLKLDGAGTGQWGILLADRVSDVTLDGVEITGFDIGLYSIGVDRFTMRNSTIARNVTQGLHGSMSNSVMESNLFERNNPSGGAFEHAVYLSGGNNITVRGNRFNRNSTPQGGACDGGNFTVHGQVDGLLVENNVVEQDASLGGCWGISITVSYASAEWMRNVVLRGNTIVNAGYHSIRATGAPGILIEGNKLINLQNQYQVAISVPADGHGTGDDANRDAIVRNNTVCLVSPNGGGALSVTAPGSTVSSNVYRTGTDATSGVCTR